MQQKRKRGRPCKNLLLKKLKQQKQSECFLKGQHLLNIMSENNENNLSDKQKQLRLHISES